MSLELNIFINKIQRIPTPKVQELLREYQEEIQKLPFNDQNAILNFIEKRFNIVQRMSQSDIMVNMMLFQQLGERGFLPRAVNQSTEKELMELELIPLIESLNYIDTKNVEAILRKYHSKLDPKIIETLIINLPEDKQIAAIQMCKSELMNSEPNTFHNFMASISKEAQKHILENFGEKFEKYSPEDISNVSTCLYQENMETYTSRYQTSLQNSGNLFELLIACNEENLENTINQFKEQLHDLDADDLMQVLCFKSYNSSLLLNLWSNMPDKISEVSLPYFKTFIRRLEDKERYNAIYILSDKFKEMDLNEIVELFEYDPDEVKAKVLIEFRDRFTGEESETLKKFMTKSVRNKMSDIYAEKQRDEFESKKNNGIDLTAEFASIVSELKDDKRHKLFDDDYIRAITLAKMLLLEDKSIDDQNPSYIELRNK